MKRRILQTTLLAILCAAAPLALVQAGVVVESFGLTTFDPQENLFTSIGRPTSPGLLAGVGAAEEWPVSINLARLQTLPETVVLNLPGQESDTLIRLRAEPRAGNGYLWTGGGEGCSALLSAKPNQFRATISCLSGNYGVETTSSGPRLTRYVYEPAPLGAENDVVLPASTPTSPNIPANTETHSLDGPASLDTEIDVLVLYTANVRQALQAVGIDATTYMQDTLAATQMAMDRSTSPGDAVIAELNLVHAQEVAHAESGQFLDDLNYLRLDSIAVGLRNTYAADLVMLIRESSPQPNQCGLAYGPGILTTPPPGPGFAPFAVAVTKRQCSFSAYPFQHEFGHLFGGNHNPEDNSNPTPLHPWAFAHWDNAPNPEDSARTLLSYQIQTCHAVARRC